MENNFFETGFYQLDNGDIILLDDIKTCSDDDFAKNYIKFLLFLFKKGKFSGNKEEKEIVDSLLIRTSEYFGFRLNLNNNELSTKTLSSLYKDRIDKNNELVYRILYFLEKNRLTNYNVPIYFIANLYKCVIDLDVRYVSSYFEPFMPEIKRIFEKQENRIRESVRKEEIKSKTISIDDYEGISFNPDEDRIIESVPESRSNMGSALKFFSNSCYIDSILVALFYLPNRDVKRNFFDSNLLNIAGSGNISIKCSKDLINDIATREKIREELENIQNHIRTKSNESMTCQKLRKIFSECKGGSQDFSTPNTQDACEFLQYLINLFNYNNSIIRRKTFLSKDGHNFVESSSLDFVNGPIISVDPRYLKDNYNLQDSLNVVEYTEFDIKNKVRFNNDFYSYKEECSKMLFNSSLLIFEVRRKYLSNEGKEVRNTSSIFFPDSIMIESATKKLNHYAVLVHDKQHYTLYIKIENQWYYYNDLEENRFVLTTLKNDFFPSPYTHGTLYFYQ